MSGERGDRPIGHLGAIATPGTVIAGKYHVERVLGSGGMGVVLAAKHLHLGQRVAIKFMREEAAQEPQAVSRFLREAQAAASLSSEHVTKVLDVGTLESGVPYMVMEFLSGVDLGAVLQQRGPLPIREAVGNVLQACEAIAEAHAVGIVHRDLKPANLFITRRVDGTPLVKVLDFGISKLTELNDAGRREDLTASGSIMGSPGYMSPEQVRNAKAADARSDIWSLGVILYETVTGKNPFIGETIGETFARIVSESPPPIQSLRPDVPPGLAEVIGQCLERAVARRTQTIDHLATKLAPFGSDDARAIVERIRRITASFRQSREGSQATALAPETMAAPNTGLATGSAAWLRSAAAAGPARAAPPWRKWVAVAVGPAIAVPAMVFVILVVRARQDASGSNLGPASSQGSAHAAPAEGAGPVLAAPSTTPPGPAETALAGREASGSARSGPSTPKEVASETLAPASDGHGAGPDVAADNASPGPPAEGANGRPFGSRRANDVVQPNPAHAAARIPRVSIDAGPPARGQAAPVTPPKKSPYDDL